MTGYKESVDSLMEAVRKVAGSVQQKDLDVLIGIQGYCGVGRGLSGHH